METRLKLLSKVSGPAIFLFTLSLITSASTLLAEKNSAEENNVEEKELSATQIIDYMEDLYRGKSSLAAITMSVKTPHYERELKMEAESLGRERSMIRILSPKKDRGITTLKRDKEMWNFFPKISKVIKVPPSMMMGSWMGSDFTNDDLVKESSLTEDYQLELNQTPTHYTIILIPRELTVTVWGKIEYKINKKLMIPEEQTFFDEKMEKIRVLSFKEPTDFDGRLLPAILEMIPLNKDGYKTRIVYTDIQFDLESVTEDTFSLRNLKRRF